MHDYKGILDVTVILQVFVQHGTTLGSDLGSVGGLQVEITTWLAHDEGTNACY